MDLYRFSGNPLVFKILDILQTNKLYTWYKFDQTIELGYVHLFVVL